jgi:hypothetical protein
LNPEKATKSDPISQTEIRRAYILRREIRHQQAALDAILDDLFNRLKAGVHVEDGTHRAKIETTRESGSIRERIKIT